MQTLSPQFQRQQTILYGLAAFAISGVLLWLPPVVSGILMGGMLIGVGLLASPLVAVMLLLVVAPLRVLIATEAPGAFPADTGQFALVLLIGVWLMHYIGKFRRLPVIPLSVVYVPLLAVIITFGLTALTAWSLQTWLTEWIKWVQIAVLTLLVLDMRQYWRWIMAGLAAAGTANALVGIYQFFGGSGALHLLVNGQNFRAFGTFGQPNPFGGFMGLLAPPVTMMTLGYGWRIWRRFRKGQTIQAKHVWSIIGYGLATALITVGLLFSWSRGAWLAWVASMGVITISIPQRLWQSVLLVVAGISLLTGMWYAGLLPQSITDRLQTITSEVFNVADVRGVEITTANYAVVERLAHWQAAVRMANDNPWLGVGAGNYEVAYENYRLINWEEPLGHAHNYYLNVLAETGMIGTVAYISLWVSIYVLTWRARRHPDGIARSLAIGLLGTWTYLMVHSLTENLYVSNLFLFIGIMLGLLAVLNDQLNRTVQVELR